MSTSEAVSGTPAPAAVSGDWNAESVDAVSAGPRLSLVSSGERPVFDLDDLDLYSVTPEVWDLIEKNNEPPKLFKLGQLICRIEKEEDGPVSIQTVNTDRMRHVVAEVSKWAKRRYQFTSYGPPPVAITRDLLVYEDPPVPPITRITQVPVFDRKGRLIHAPGYDRNSHVYYDPCKNLEIPTVARHPIAEASAAKQLLLDEMLVDFPFEGEADRAHALAMILQPFVREMIEGPTPLYAIDASSPGSGKSLLAQCGTLIAHGDERSLLPPTDSEEEIRKRVFATLQESTPVFQIDNQHRTLNSGVLAAVLTAYPTWKDRRLGVSETVCVPVRNTWIVTGNNLQLSEEMNRRAVRIRLVPDQGRPWERAQAAFRHSDLISWVRENRDKLVWAALTLINSWVYVGCPRSTKNLGSYEHWAALLGGIFEHVGVPGFLENREAQYEALDAGSDDWTMLVNRWHEHFGEAEISAAQLLDIVIGPADALFAEEPLLDLSGSDRGANAVSLGKQLGNKRDAIFGGFKITKVPSRGHHSARWKLIPVSLPT